MPATSTERPAHRGRAAALVAGDIVALLVFAAMGRGSHGLASGLAAVGETARTAAPFIIGWLAVAPWLGAFAPAATRGVGPMLRVTLLAWLPALAAGALLRAAAIGRLSPLSFYLVTLIVGLLLLAGWRAAFALAEGRYAQGAARRA
jgi:hypothetical protein